MEISTLWQTRQGGWDTVAVGVATVFGMLAGGADALFNVATFGGKALAKKLVVNLGEAVFEAGARALGKEGVEKALREGGQAGLERALRESGEQALREGAERALRFGADDLVYGPSARGALRELQESAGGRLLTDLPKPINQTFREFSLSTLKTHLDEGGKLWFDLTHVKDLKGVLSGTGEHAAKVTSHELRWLKDNWESVKGSVTFLRNGTGVGAPWP